MSPLKKIIRLFPIVALWPMAIYSEEINSVEYWRLRFSGPSESLVWNDYRSEKSANLYPLLSMAGIGGMCMRDPRTMRMLRNKYRNIIDYARPRTTEIDKDFAGTPLGMAIEQEQLVIIHLIDGKLDSAIEASRKTRQWLWKDIELKKNEQKAGKFVAFIDMDIYNYKAHGFTEMTLMEIANREFGGHYSIDHIQIDDIGWIHNNSAYILEYVLLLFRLGELERFESFISSELDKKGRSQLFISREIAGIVFENILRQEYWLTPEFRAAIEKLNKRASRDLPSCRLADFDTMECTPWDDIDDLGKGRTK